MDKEKIYSITDLTDILNIAESTIRKYEGDFNIKIPRNSKGHRYYVDKEIDLYKQILELKKSKYSKEQINELLGRSVIAEEQREIAIEKVKVQNLTVEELKDTMGKYIAEIITQKEEELTKRYEKN